MNSQLSVNMLKVALGIYRCLQQEGRSLIFGVWELEELEEEEGKLIDCVPPVPLRTLAGPTAGIPLAC